MCKDITLTSNCQGNYTYNIKKSYSGIGSHQILRRKGYPIFPVNISVSKILYTYTVLWENNPVLKSSILVYVSELYKVSKASFIDIPRSEINLRTNSLTNSSIMKFSFIAS